MFAIVTTGVGAYDLLLASEVATPVTGDGEVLRRVVRSAPRRCWAARMTWWRHWDKHTFRHTVSQQAGGVLGRCWDVYNGAADALDGSLQRGTRPGINDQPAPLRWDEVWLGIRIAFSPARGDFGRIQRWVVQRARQLIHDAAILDLTPLRYAEGDFPLGHRVWLHRQRRDVIRGHRGVGDAFGAIGEADLRRNAEQLWADPDSKGVGTCQRSLHPGRAHRHQHALVAHSD